MGGCARVAREMRPMRDRGFVIKYLISLSSDNPTCRLWVTRKNIEFKCGGASGIPEHKYKRDKKK